MIISYKKTLENRAFAWYFVKMDSPLKQYSGFPSPAEDFYEQALDIRQLLIKNPLATFLMKISESAVIGEQKQHRINPGDYIIVDRSLTPKSNQIVVSIADQNFHILPCSSLKKQQTVWGVVTYVIHSPQQTS